MAIEPVGPIFGHGPPWTIIPAMASGHNQRPPDQLSKHSPQLKGNSFHSSMNPVLKVAGVVHIWNKSHNSNSRSQNSTPILKEDLSAHQSGNPWRQSEDHSRTPTT
ncbi:hypothetical protein O181_104894 [Austropuccinia psidii MF-1]|uniref:Uncharacterized protein n=1 Tax=Austropuccinia psidii MF-1 TaxID=1389203 RepID=A0A9Q3JP53_9BASI|nr:hypothetical protein [Austropuccinia psidii MF-1]